MSDTTTITAVSRKEAERKRILRAILRRVRSGRPFTVDELWDRLPDVKPVEHRAWLGREIQIMEKDGRIRFVEWKETPRSLPRSRPVRVWQQNGDA